MKTNNHYLNMLREIKSAAFATVDENGCPQNRIIDIMLVENDALIFCTARGKAFYRQLCLNPNTAILGMTKTYQTIRLTGKAEHLSDQKFWIDKIFEANPVMNTVYPGQSRYVLEPFCIRSGTLEYFDLSKTPIIRASSAIGTAEPLTEGFEISDACISCGKCAKGCPQQCIQQGNIYEIKQTHCLHCGYCMEVCPIHAIKRRIL